MELILTVAKPEFIQQHGDYYNDNDIYQRLQSPDVHTNNINQYSNTPKVTNKDNEQPHSSFIQSLYNNYIISTPLDQPIRSILPTKTISFVQFYANEYLPDSILAIIHPKNDQNTPSIISTTYTNTKNAVFDLFNRVGFVESDESTQKYQKSGFFSTILPFSSQNNPTNTDNDGFLTPITSWVSNLIPSLSSERETLSYKDLIAEKYNNFINFIGIKSRH